MWSRCVLCSTCCKCVLALCHRLVPVQSCEKVLYSIQTLLRVHVAHLAHDRWREAPAMPNFSCKRLRHRCVQHSTGGAWQLPASPKVHCAHRAVQYRCHLCVASRQRCLQRTPTSSKRPSPHAKYMRSGVFASRSPGFLRNFVSTQLATCQTRIFNEHDTNENVTVHHFPNIETSII
jgi:hypothetical protein